MRFLCQVLDRSADYVLATDVKHLLISRVNAPIALVGSDIRDVGRNRIERRFQLGETRFQFRVAATQAVQFCFRCGCLHWNYVERYVDSQCDLYWCNTSVGRIKLYYERA